MSRSGARPDVIVVQVRDKPETALHERLCIAELLGVPVESLRSWNVVEQPLVDRAWREGFFDGADAVIIGGSAGHSATEDGLYTDPLARVVQEMVDERRPLFGSCFGHQFIARALGGEVVHDESRAEVGSATITLTEAAFSDAVFAGLPERFEVLMGHEDRVTSLPPTGVELAYSSVCRNQAFRLDGAPVWCTQFHSEMTPRRLIERLRAFPRYMNDDQEAIDALERALKPTPHGAAVLGRFLETVVG